LAWNRQGYISRIQKSIRQRRCQCHGLDRHDSRGVWGNWRRLWWRKAFVQDACGSPEISSSPGSYISIVLQSRAFPPDLTCCSMRKTHVLPLILWTRWSSQRTELSLISSVFNSNLLSSIGRQLLVAWPTGTLKQSKDGKVWQVLHAARDEHVSPISSQEIEELPRETTFEEDYFFYLMWKGSIVTFLRLSTSRKPRRSLLSILSLYWSRGVNVMFAWCWSWTLWQCSWRVVSEWSRCKHFDLPFSDACFSSNRYIHDSNANLASLFHYCINQNTFQFPKIARIYSSFEEHWE
jgi:hypothetical protein